MTWADLEKLQGTKRPDGTMMIVIRDDRAASAITEKRSLSILFAISRVMHGRSVVDDKYGGNGKVVYTTAGPPPGFLIEAVAAAGGSVFDGKTEHALAKPPELGMLLDGTFCDFAIEVKRRFKVRTMRDALEVREIELRKRPVDVSDPVARWTAVYELMALVGEAAREKRPGRWSFDREQKARFPLVLDFGRGAKLAPGRMAEAIVSGSATSITDLLAVLDKSDAATLVDPMATLPLLHDRRTLPADDIVTEPLIDNETDSPELPVVAYIEDRDEGYRWPQGVPITPELRRRALANLGARRFEVDVAEIPQMGVRIAFVIGDFYAAETILHRPTMRRVEAKLGAELLLVGVPSRGELLAIDSAIAMADDEVLTSFLRLVEKKYLDNPEAARISSEVIVYDGKPIGRVQSNLMDTRRALRRMGIDPDA
ncbi:MAG: hypothetical protein AB7T06_31960 [Kofleriaceae bacterium]